MSNKILEGVYERKHAFTEEKALTSGSQLQFNLLGSESVNTTTVLTICVTEYIVIQP